MAKAGDVVVICKPQDVEVFPYWVDSMDKYDGRQIVMPELEAGAMQPCFHYDGWDFSPNWVAPVNGKNQVSPSESPTLLDQFAMAALTGLLAKGGWLASDSLAREAYTAARCMMKAREVQK